MRLSKNKINTKNLFESGLINIKSLLFFIIAIVGFSSVSYAQDNKNNKDFQNVKSPAIEYSVPDLENVMFEEEFKDTSKAKETYSFEKDNELDMENVPMEEISEDDTVYFDEEEGEFQVVEVNEQISMDSVWVTIASYYAIWDSRFINPYKIDPTEYKDTVQITLFDSLSGFNWKLPLDETKINSRFGFRRIRWHYGTDLDLDIGDAVYSCFDGIVRIVSWDGRGYGRYIVVRHYNGLETLYGHLSAANVEVGQLVKAGEMIGLGGNTGRSSGPHLHFEIRYEGNCIDPELVFNFPEKNIRFQTFNLSPSHFNYLKEARKVYYHTVRRGDTLGSIARKYRVRLSHILRLNRLSSKSTIRAGRKIRIR